MYPKALACGADIVCVELEDGIAPKDKAAARASAMALFAEPQADDGVERIVRINCVREAFGLADVLAVLASDTPPPALMLPKVRTPDEVVSRSRCCGTCTAFWRSRNASLQARCSRNQTFRIPVSVADSRTA